jgi:alpha-tubulin suppressor-like RCC1 family protein
MNIVSFPYSKLIGLCAVITMLTPFQPANMFLPGQKNPVQAGDPLTTGIYTPDNPAIVYSGSDWTVSEGAAETKIAHAIALWQVTLKEAGVVVVQYHPAADAGQFQVQLDSEPADDPVNQSSIGTEEYQYWVSRTLKPGTHKVFFTSLDERPVNFTSIAIGPVVKSRDAVYDNADPGAIIFGEWTTTNFPVIANGGKAIVSGLKSGPIIVVFDQQFPGSVNVNLISTEEAGQAHIVLDGLPTNFPYQTPGEPIAVSIIVGKTEPGRHVLMISGDGAGNVVRFDGYKLSEKRPANMPTIDPKDDPNSSEYKPIITVEHSLPVLSAGKYHACYVDRNGGVNCRGYNASGQLGRGPEETSLNILPLGTVYGLDSGVQAVASGGYHTCVLMAAGTVKCWGSGQFGQLGNGVSNATQNQPVDVVELGGKVVDITAGEYHTCALLSDGRVQCWGLNGAGQLGNGISQEFLGRNKPVDVTGLPSPAVGIAAGSAHTCARLMDSSLWCWGNDEYGQLGDGSIVKSISVKGKPTPVKVTGLDAVTLVSAGSRHTCAMNDKVVYCWGDNSFGQLGNGSVESSPVPQKVTGLYNGVYTLASGERHTCALSPNQSETIKGIQCWGDNAYSQMGNSFKGKLSSEPVDITGYTGEKALISAGYEYTCVVSKDDQAYCWGLTSYGQAGNLTDAPPVTGQPEPQATPTPTPVEAESVPGIVSTPELPGGLSEPVIGPTPVNIQSQ